MDTGSRTASVELSTGHGDLGIEVGCDIYFRTVRVFYSDISYPRGVFFAVGTYLPCLALPYCFTHFSNSGTRLFVWGYTTL
jgi:hypothetical protein